MKNNTSVSIHTIYLLLAGLSPVPCLAQGLGLTPMKMEFPAVAGKAYSGTLLLNNSSTQKVRVRTEILDFYVDENQTPQFMLNVPKEQAFSCRSWLAVNPMEADVEPQSQLSARYTMRVPDGVNEGSHHCAIGFVSVPSGDSAQGIGVRTAIRVVSTFYPIIGQSQVAGKIAQLILEPLKAGNRTDWRGIVVMENLGLMLYRPRGRVDVIDAGGAVLETLQLASFPVLPQRQQRFLLPLKHELAAGRYTLRAHIDLGHQIQEASAEVSVSTTK